MIANRPIPDRLQSLASDFLNLQGLHQVAVGIMLLLVIAVLEFNSAWDIWFFLALLILLGIASWHIRAYYERRFGYVKLRTHPGFWGSGHPFLRRVSFWIPVLLLSWALEKMADVSPLGCLLGFLFVGYSMTENRPSYYLLFSLPFFLIAGIGHFLHDPICLLWIQLWLVPVTFIIAGVLDHLRLVRLFSKVRSDGAA